MNWARRLSRAKPEQRREAFRAVAKEMAPVVHGLLAFAHAPTPHQATAPVSRGSVTEAAAGECDSVWSAQGNDRCRGSGREVCPSEADRPGRIATICGRRGDSVAASLGRVTCPPCSGQAGWGTLQASRPAALLRSVAVLPHCCARWQC